MQILILQGHVPSVLQSWRSRGIPRQLQFPGKVHIFLGYRVSVVREYMWSTCLMLLGLGDAIDKDVSCFGAEALGFGLFVNIGGRRKQVIVGSPY